MCINNGCRNENQGVSVLEALDPTENSLSGDTSAWRGASEAGLKLTGAPSSCTTRTDMGEFTTHLKKGPDTFSIKTHWIPKNNAENVSGPTAAMSALDVSNTLDDARVFTRIDQVKVKHRPRLLSDNGPCYIAGELSDYLAGHGMTHTRGRPYHPQTQGKIERWHRSMKNQILLENYYLPGELRAALQKFVDYYNHERYHESLKNLTPPAVQKGSTTYRNLVWKTGYESAVKGLSRK
jgi:hypothetical protein